MKIHQFLVVSGIVLLPTSVLAAENSPLEAIYSCADVTDDQARLACYDAAVGSARTAQSAGEFTTITREEVKAAKKDTFGFSVPSLPKLALPKFGSADQDDDVKTNANGEIEEVVFNVARVGQSTSGAVEVYFDNGQVWRQTDSKPVRISKKLAPPETATIKQAMLGSFRIKLSTGQSFKAERVR